MNSLARAVHGMVVGHKSLGDVSGDLTAQERAALADMQPVLSRSPEDLARVLAKAPTQSEWWRFGHLAKAPTQSEWWRSADQAQAPTQSEWWSSPRMAQAPTQSEWWSNPKGSVSRTPSRV